MTPETRRILAQSRPGASRSALLIALGVSLILVSFILIFSTRTGPGKQSGIDQFSPDDVPDILSAPGEGVARIDGPPQVGETTNARIRLKDRGDASRMAWDIEFARLSPVKDSDLVEIDRPRAWYLLGDSNLVFIRSDKAEFLMPDITSEPVSGRFTGNVEVLQFERRSDGSLPAPVVSDSAVRITTNWLDFDAVASELSTTETVLIASESIDADCSGLTIVFNEVDERVELLEIPGALVATIRPGAAREDEPAPTTYSGEEPPTAGAAQPRPAQANAAPKPEPEAPTGPETFYAVTFEGSVHVEQPSRQIDADRARVWLRLVDNKLPEESLAAMPSHHRDPVGLQAALAAMVVASRQPEVPTDRDLKLEDNVLFRCVGPTVVRPMDERPAALGSGDDVALRFESNPGGKVTFTDSVLLAKGESSAIEYGFTTKVLALTGYDGQPTVLAVEDAGTIVGESLTIGLATGIGQAMGAGVLTEAGSGRSLAWNEQADVVFRTEEGWITGSIEQAIASGTIVLRDEGSEVTAQTINTRFAPGEKSLIERAVLTGGVRARTERGSLDADRLDVRFDTVSGKSEARAVTASGQVRGEQDDSVITAGLLEADLDSNENGKPHVTVARASETVRFTRADGAFAEGENLRAELTTETVLVEGAPARVGSGAASVSSRSITLTGGQSRSISVPGPGEFTLTDEAGTRTLASATWTGAMAFADDSGELEAQGEVVAVSTPDELSRDTLTGEKLFALVQPSDGSAVLGEGADRQLISAEITGAEGQNASVEVLRFGEADAVDPSRVTLLQGPRIEVDNIGGIVRVPAPGRLLVSDRRLDAAETDTATMRGSALFDWEGELLLDRPAGEMTMTSRVRMVHRPLGDGAVAELECESLRAMFAEEAPGAELTSAQGEGELREVVATGAVWARSGEQQMIADALNYAAETQAARATAQPGGWVTLFDPAQPAPVTAAELLWSLKSGRIEVVRPNPISIPR